MSLKLLGFGEACPGVLKVSCCGVALKFGERRVNDLELLYGYVVGKSMHVDLHTPCLPYVLIIFFTRPFVCNALFLFLVLVFSYVQTPNKPG